MSAERHQRLFAWLNDLERILEFIELDAAAEFPENPVQVVEEAKGSKSIGRPFPEKNGRRALTASRFGLVVIGIILSRNNTMSPTNRYALPGPAKELLERALARQGLRGTRHREMIFGILLTRRDHPTADEVYGRVKAMAPTISLATVYNCLETLVQCGLVRAVNHERDATRFCPNLSEHAHFHDRQTGRIYDVDLPDEVIARLKTLLPEGYEAESVELNFHGRSRGSSGPRAS